MLTILYYLFVIYIVYGCAFVLSIRKGLAKSYYKKEHTLLETLMLVLFIVLLAGYVLISVRVEGYIGQYRLRRGK